LDGQEEFHGGLRDADDGGGINGLFAVRNSGDVEDGIRLRKGVIAGVAAEWAFDEEVGVGGDWDAWTQRATDLIRDIFA
jgi:hypothetical protein